MTASAPGRRTRAAAIAALTSSLLLGQAALLAVAAHAATVLNVSTTADVTTSTGACGNSGIVTPPGTLSLREATCLANNIGGAVTINLPAGHFTLTNGELQLGTASGDNDTIVGQTATATIIDGNGTGRVLNLDPNLTGGVTTSIAGVTITNGAVTTSGGAGIIGGSGIATTADSLSINDSTISNNHVGSTTSNRPGGGVQFEGGSLTINNSVVINNSSGSSDGSGVHYIAEGTASGEQLTVSNSGFVGNSATPTVAGVNIGGALSLGASGPVTMTVSDSTFANNTVTGTGTSVPRGAGILSQNGTLNVLRSTFIGNSVSGGSGASGGAIAVLGGTATAHYNRITGNVGAAGSGAYLTSGGTLDATDNWWGCSTGAGTTGCDTVGGSPTVAPYLKLTATASPATVIGPGATSTITAALTTDSALAAVSPANLGAFTSLQVSWSDPLPSGAAVTPPSSTLGSGTASATYSSNNSIGPGHVIATFDNGTATASIAVDRAPVISSGSTATFTVGSAGSFTVTTTGYPAPAITKTGALPSGVTLVDNGNGTATLAGTPAAGTGGTYPITLTANNTVSPNATQSFFLVVNQAPVFTSANSTTFTAGTASSFAVTTSAYPTPTVTTSSALPSGVTFHDNGNGTATVAGTPAVGTGGAYSLALVANNGVSPNGTQNLVVSVNEAPAVTASPADQLVAPGASVTFTAAASGYPTPTVQWQVSTDGGLSFGNITGATATGYTFTATTAHDGNKYRAVFSNAAGTATTTAATLTVAAAPAISSTNATTFSVGTAGSFTVTTTGYPAAALTASGNVPAWVTFHDNGDGTASITGTPPVGSGGQYTFTLNAVNGHNPNAGQSFTLTVDESPTITSADHSTFIGGAAGNFLVTTSAGFPVATTVSKTGTLPTGVTFTPNGSGGATISGTPAAGTAGTYILTISATNGASPAASQTFTLTVVESPTFTSADHATFVVGTAGSFAVTTSGAPSRSVSYTGTLPSGVSFTASGTGATISGTPAAGTGGVYPITLTAGDGLSPDTAQTFTLTVNQPPHLTSADHTSFVLNTAGSFTVTTTAGQPTSTTLSKTGSLPAGVSFTDNGDGTATIAGTPTAAGSYPITVTASNGVAPDSTQTFTLTVNQAPNIISADHATFTVASAGSFTVTTSPSAVSVAKTGALPSGVTFTDNGDGTATLAGTPAVGTGGSFPLTITATNATGFTTQSFTLTVSEVPVITSATATSFAVGSSNTFTVTTTAGFPAATTLSSAGSLPTGVAFHDNGDGTATLSGTPAAGTFGSYPLTLTATNTVGHTDQSFTLTVTQAPVITSVDHTTFTVGAAGSFTVTTTPAAVSITKTGGLPTGVTLHDNGDGTATLAGTAAAATGGAYVLTLAATNATGFTTQTFTLTVDEPPAITSVDHTGFAVATAGTFTVTTAPGTPSATSITRSGALPTGVTFTDNHDGTATLAGTPAAGTVGSYPLVLTASNGVNPDSVQSFTLTVAALTQTITVTSTPPAPALVGGTYHVVAVSDSGLTVAVTIDPASAAVCSISGSSVSFTAPGTCVIDLNQAGNGTYAPAAQLQQSVTVGKVVTAVVLTPSLAHSVFGQPVTVSAAVSYVGGTPAGSVQFSVDGSASGTPVAVAAGYAVSAALVLAPGAHTVSAVFTPTDATTYATSTGSTQSLVDQAGTSATVSVQPTTVTATVAAVAPGSGRPTGQVVVSVNGHQVGSAALVSGTATLAYRVPSGHTQQVSVAYAGDADFTGSSASTARHDPQLVARVTSAAPKSRFGWYRTPVTITFTCTAADAPLVGACPAPVRLTQSRAGQSVTRTVMSADGGAATAVVVVNLDRTPPRVRVSGVHNGAVYTGTVPVAHCVATDALSGVASCTLVQHRSGDTTTYRVTATDKAGNTATATGRYRTLPITLTDAPLVKGAFQVHAGSSYTLVVYATTAPVYYDAALAPRLPSGRDKPMYSAGHGKWVLRITMRKPMHAGVWTIGVRIGKTLHVVTIRVV